MIKRYLKEFIEKNYYAWGIELETKLPPEFIISEHAEERLRRRLKNSKEKDKKITIKAWTHGEVPDKRYLYRVKKDFPKGIYKIYMGFIFIFRIRYNKRLGFSQKFLVTILKKKGYQYED